ncbi:MAG: hypothetical protein WCV83_00015 [Candidatus Magasanikbacteria bacterium]|jgi:hypothetical protein
MKIPLFFIPDSESITPTDTAQAIEQPKQIYTVKVADNFHYMDDSESYTYGDFETYDEAVAVCKAIVDEDFAGYVAKNIPPEKMYDNYTGMGSDPWIFPDPVGQPRFSAWTYAKQLAEALQMNENNQNKKETEEERRDRIFAELTEGILEVLSSTPKDEQY